MSVFEPFHISFSLNSQNWNNKNPEFTETWCFPRSSISSTLKNKLQLKSISRIGNFERYSWSFHSGYIDVGDRCWRRNVLATTLRCWCRFGRFRHKHPLSFNISATNICVTISELFAAFDHQILMLVSQHFWSLSRYFRQFTAFSSVFLLENRSEEPVYASQIKLTMVNLFSINKSCPINNLDLLVKVQNGSELGSCTMPKIVLCWHPNP